MPGDETVLALPREAPETKWSGSHRRLIWRFTADRNGGRPPLGWGMDASRVLPRGKAHFAEVLPSAGVAPDGEALPLRPHDAVLAIIRLACGVRQARWLAAVLPAAATGAAVTSRREAP